MLSATLKLGPTQQGSGPRGRTFILKLFLNLPMAISLSHRPVHFFSNAWFTFSSRVLVETFGKMWTRRSTHKCRHSHSHAESSITRQDIRDIFVSFDSGMIYRHVSESFETRWEQVESVEDETNISFTLSFSSCLVPSQWECKLGITGFIHWMPVTI